MAERGKVRPKKIKINDLYSSQVCILYLRASLPLYPTPFGHTVVATALSPQRHSRIKNGDLSDVPHMPNWRFG